MNDARADQPKILKNIPGVPTEDLKSTPVYFSPAANHEIELLFDQLTTYLTKRAKKYTDPISREVFSASPTVVVEFNEEAVPVCAVKHNSSDLESNEIVFYEYEPHGRHIGTLYRDNHGNIAVVNSQDPRTIDFSDIKPYEIRDFVGSLAQNIQDKKLRNRIKNFKPSTTDVATNEMAGSSPHGAHHTSEPVEQIDGGKYRRVRLYLKKFAFKHPFITAELAALVLNIIFQAIVAYAIHQF